MKTSTCRDGTFKTQPNYYKLDTNDTTIFSHHPGGKWRVEVKKQEKGRVEVRKARERESRSKKSKRKARERESRIKKSKRKGE